MTCPTVIRVTTGTGPPGIGLPAGASDAGKFVRKAGSTPYAYELVTPDQVGLPQGLATNSSPTFAGLTLSGQASPVVRLVVVGANGQLVSLAIGTNLAIVDGALVAAGGSGGSGGYPSLTMPTGFSVAGNTTASLVVTFATGYSLPTNIRQGLWDTAYSERLYWDGSNTGLNPVAGRASLALGTAAQSATTDFASAAQGAKADTAVQPAALATALAGKVDTTDARLTDTREWSAATATQAEAEAGTSTTRLAFTPQRVFQAIAAWWAASAAKTKLDGIATGATANQTDAFLLSRANHAGTQAAGTITGLATVATSGAYGDLSGRLVISSATPQPLGTAAAGTSGQAADAAHVHARSTYADLGAIADGIVFTISNRGETATASTNYDESLPLSFAVTITKITFITHIDNTGSSTTTLNAYKRTAAGTKTSLLSANATLASGASVATGSLSGTAGVLSLAAGDRLGVDLIGLGTGASGIKCIIEYTRSAV